MTKNEWEITAHETTVALGHYFSELERIAKRHHIDPEALICHCVESLQTAYKETRKEGGTIWKEQ